jgi:hypothetical protein
MRLSARLIPFAVLLLTASGCAGIGGGRDDVLASAITKLPRFPACENEIKAFVALTRLARQLGDNWRVYEPALEAMQDQILDCVEESYPNPVPI